VLLEGESLTTPLTDEEITALDITSIKGGLTIIFLNHLLPGKTTIFDFYAPWCGPCKVYTPQLERLLLQNSTLALVKADIVDWKSPLAKQLTTDYHLFGLPFTLVFNDQGLLLGKVNGNNIEAVLEILQQK
jgi:thiol-disulfide isomerase/thioredoxin